MSLTPETIETKNLSNASIEHIHLFTIELDRVRTPLTISIWLLIVIGTKIVFHMRKKLDTFFPDSALLIVLGLIFGGFLHFLWPSEVFLEPELFFLYLLPPIVLDAGYFLPNRAFFRNLLTILTYAVIGTLWNVFTIGLTLYAFREMFSAPTTVIDIFLFSSLISAVDPVAVLCVFEEIHVNQLLYICVFGESLLNDAVTIVLYNMFGSMARIGGENLIAADYTKSISSFFIVAFGGIGIGIIWAAATGFTTKYSEHLNVVQPMICLLFPYLAYLFAELLHFSGILSIVVCGLVMKQYVTGNISKKSLITVKYFLKTLSSSCEAIIFVFLGLSTVSKNHHWDFLFVGVTVVACFVYRFIGVFMLTKLLNRGRVQKIGIVDQFIMAYGGLRGAVCYGLVMSLDSVKVPAKNMYATTTIVVILFTVFIQGVTIKPLVNLLKVKREVQRKRTVYEMLLNNAQDHMMAGIESVVGYHGHYWIRQMLSDWNTNYIQPLLMRNPKSHATKIVHRYEAESVKDATEYLRKHGSFAGMHLVNSPSRAAIIDEQCATIIDMNGSNNMWLKVVDKGTTNKQQTQPNASLPRNESLSAIVKEKFDEVKKKSFKMPKDQKVNLYSRHLLESDIATRMADHRDKKSTTPMTDNERRRSSLDDDDDESYALTFPLSQLKYRRPTSLSKIREIFTDEDGNNSGGGAFQSHRKMSNSAQTDSPSTSTANDHHHHHHKNERPKFVISSGNDLIDQIKFVEDDGSSSQSEFNHNSGNRVHFNIVSDGEQHYRHRPIDDLSSSIESKKDDQNSVTNGNGEDEKHALLPPIVEQDEESREIGN